MITMSSDAMPMSLMPRVFPELRRIIGLAILAFVLAGCSVMRLAYDTAPNLLYWWVDGYVDVNDEQAPRLREGIDRWFAWHRRTQLPDYVALLARAQREIVEPTTAAAMCSWASEIEKRVDAALDGALPATAELILSLTPEQLRHLERRFTKKNDELRTDFLQSDPAERRAKALERSQERFESLYGRLDAAQRERLAEGLSKSSFDPERWLVERRLRQRDMLQALNTVSTAARGGAAVQQAQAAARTIAAQWARSPRPDYRAYQQRLLQDNCALAATMHNAMTPAQRLHARTKLKGWEDDLRALATRASIDNGAASR
jgi:hypothetical protein